MTKQLVAFLFSLFLISSCKTTAYFNTSNDVSKELGTIFLEDGTEKSGEITIQLENDLLNEDSLTFKYNGTSEKINLKDIKGYNIKGEYYVPKYINLNFNNENHLLFVKRLTKENSRIQLYELFQRNQGIDRHDLYSYFISLPTHSKYENWSIASINLVPNFDVKMSKIVEDCPQLATKIKQKDKDYFLPRLTLSDKKKLGVFKRIIDEYNSCK